MSEINNIPLGIYKHFKGDIYEVLMIAIHSETLEKYVIYSSINSCQIITRPLKMFVELVDEKPRFEYIGEELK